MNYLAHATLAEHEAELVMGNMAGDWVKGRLDALPPSPFVTGLWMHRQVDAFVDAHPAWLASRDRFAPERRRYAGIVVDVIYDHFLARDWLEHPPVPGELRDYTGAIYGWFGEHQSILPADFRPVAQRMAETDWLGSYADRDATCYAIERISRRLRRPDGLAACVQDIDAHYDELAADFARLWPDLVAYAHQLRLHGGI